MKSNIPSAVQTSFLLLIVNVITITYAVAQPPVTKQATIDVGVAKVDITPETPIRLTGYGARDKSETREIIHRLEGKAMAFGSDAQHPSIIITVDLLGITERIASKVREQLSEKAGVDPAQVVFCASHTHGGPEIGSAINILQYREDEGYTDSLLPLDQLIHIAEYTETLKQKLIDVSLEALKNRSPALVDWGQGQAYFAKNRRTEGGPVDVALPILRISNTDGTLRAVFVSYACHGTTFEGINKINGDWIVEAKQIIEARHPGSMAMVALGCAADADPNPRGSIEDVKKNGQEIADNVDKLLGAQLQPLVSPPSGKLRWVKLPFSKIPTVPELIKQAKQMDKRRSLYAYYARISLDRVERGDPLPSEVNLPIQVWNFGNKLAMINLGGEIVVDYSIRLKNELGAEHLWINGYSNDIPCYIASKRVIKEGGYEADYSMTCYNKPSPLKEEAENIIINAVHELMPAGFTSKRDTANHSETIVRGDDGIIHLPAVYAEATGPSIKYMPEWKAFGWFTTEDQAAWNVNIDKPGKYEVYMYYSVSDGEAGKSFVLNAGNKSIKGKIGKTGSWYTYSRKKIGTVNLPAGIRKMIFKSNTPAEKGAMLDLAELILVPVK
ncbi:MAG: hypothetical protein WDO19_15420 [Bacteroidota bacterium]